MDNIKNISDTGKSAKPLELTAFSKTAQRAQTKGAKGDSKLQLSKDGRKVYFSHHRSGAKLQLTKLACTLTSIFGYDLKARVGVQPNDDRQKAAAAGFAQAVKSLDPRLANTLGAVKDYDGTSKALKVAEFKEFDLENPRKVIAYNKIVAEQFVMPGTIIPTKNPRLEAILQKLNIDKDAFMSDDFARTSYPILLKAAAEEGNQRLTTKDLQTRLERKLDTFKVIIAAQASDKNLSNKIIRADTDIGIGLSKLNKALKDNNGKSMIEALAKLKTGINNLNLACDRLFPNGPGSVVNAGKYDDALLDYLIAKNMASDDKNMSSDDATRSLMNKMNKNNLHERLGMAGKEGQDPNHKLLVVLNSMAAIEDGKLGKLGKGQFKSNAAKRYTVSTWFFADLLKSLAKNVAGQDVKPNQQYQKACFGKLKLAAEGDDRELQDTVVKVISQKLIAIDVNQSIHRDS